MSVITATYNSEKTLAATMQSLLDQSYTNFEYIIIDGASTDATLGIIKHYEPLFKTQNISFRWISESDTGIYNAWNKGLRIAKGNFISFLGSDDVYYADALENYARNIQLHNRRLDFVASSVKFVFNDSSYKIIEGKYNSLIFRYGMSFCHTGGFHNKKYFDEYGYFDESYKIAGDFELLLRKRDHLKVSLLRDVIVQVGGNGVSANLVATIKEHYRASVQTGKSTRLISKMYSMWRICRVTFLNKNLLRKLGWNIR